MSGHTGCFYLNLFGKEGIVRKWFPDMIVDEESSLEDAKFGNLISAALQGGDREEAIKEAEHEFVGGSESRVG